DYGRGFADIWAEQLSTEGAATMTPLRYGATNGWLDRQPAMLVRHVGKGTLAYLGALLDPPLMQSVIAALAKDAGVTAAFGPLPGRVEVCRRVGGGREVFVLINHGETPATVSVPSGIHIVFGDGAAGLAGKVVLPPQGVLLLRQ
ncbi:MAG: beta-galactosidase, partial [Acidobacteriaceae bacterium]